MAGTVAGYSQYLNELANNLMAQTGQINYQPQSASSLKSALAKYIRPSYDKEITSLKESGKANSAAIDADAAARGMGSSSWVTDAKSKQKSAESKNIRGVESDYNSALYSALLNRLQSQDEMSQQAQYYNQAARANALNSAATPAWNLYQAALTPTVSSDSGSSYSRSGGGKPKTTTSSDLLNNYGIVTGTSPYYQTKKEIQDKKASGEYDPVVKTNNTKTNTIQDIAKKYYGTSGTTNANRRRS